MSTPLISVQNLSKNFGSVEALIDVSFEIPKGSVTAIIGPSGSGKSTVLRCLNSLVIPDQGSVRIGQVVVNFTDGSKPGSRSRAAELRRLGLTTGTVFQGNHLFPNLNVLENITLGLVRVQGKSKAEANALALELLETLGLSDKATQPVANLSGGQQQRVGIARALALQPQVLLFDEPTSALDPELVADVLDAIKTLAASGWTIVLVTHEMRFARKLANQVVFMDQGRIVEAGTAKLVLDSPQSTRAKQFLERILSH